MVRKIEDIQRKGVFAYRAFDDKWMFKSFFYHDWKSSSIVVFVNFRYMFNLYWSCNIIAYKISLTPYIATPYSDFFLICSKPMI